PGRRPCPRPGRPRRAGHRHRLALHGRRRPHRAALIDFSRVWPPIGCQSREKSERGTMDRTLVICKPDAVERGLSGEIVRRFEARGLKLVACELRTIDKETAARHYAEHEGKS